MVALTVPYLFVALDGRDRLRMLKAVSVWFLVPGLIYFVSSWAYFGYPFPNTFYAKAVIGKRTLGELWRHGYPSVEWLVGYLWLYYGVVTSRLLFGARRLRVVALNLPVLVFPFLYFLIFQTQNIGHRFQVALAPAAMLLTALHATDPSDPSPRSGSPGCVLSVSFESGSASSVSRISGWRASGEPRGG